MKIVVRTEYSKETKEFPLNNREDLAKFLYEFPSATHAAVSQGVGGLEHMANLAAAYLSTHHMTVTVEQGEAIGS